MVSIFRVYFEGDLRADGTEGTESVIMPDINRGGGSRIATQYGTTLTPEHGGHTNSGLSGALCELLGHVIAVLHFHSHSGARNQGEHKDQGQGVQHPSETRGKSQGSGYTAVHIDLHC